MLWMILFKLHKWVINKTFMKGINVIFDFVQMMVFLLF